MCFCVQDPLYRSLFKILFREGNYDPRTRNLDRRPAQIITEEMREEILEDAGMMDDMVAPKRLSSYIQSFTRRLSKISRPRGRKTEPTTYFEEYCKIYRTEDVLGVRRITEQYENENLDSNNNSCDPQDHIPFHKRFYLLDCKETVDDPDNNQLVYKLGTCISACT